MSFVVNCCHLLSPIAIRCHSLYHSFYHSLLFIVTCCHSLSFDVSLVCLFINDRKNQGQGTNQSQFMTIGIQNKKLVIKKPTTQKMKFCIKDFFSKANTQENVDFITFTKKYLTKNFIFVCSDLNLSLLIYFQCHCFFIYRAET